MQWFTFSFWHREYCYLGFPKHIVFVIFQNVFIESISWKQSRHSDCRHTVQFGREKCGQGYPLWGFCHSLLKSLWKTGFSSSVENAIRILIGKALNPKVALGIMDIFNNIDPSNLWTWNIFSFVCVFFNFFHQSLVVFIFISLVTRIPILLLLLVLWMGKTLRALY